MKATELFNRIFNNEVFQVEILKPQVETRKKKPYQSHNNPKRPVQIGIRTDVLLHIVNRCTSRYNSWCNSLPNDICIDIKELLIKLDAKNGMICLWSVVYIIYKGRWVKEMISLKKSLEREEHRKNMRVSLKSYLPDGLRCRSSLCNTFTLALIELKRSWSGSMLVDGLDVVVAFWYGDRIWFGEFILISALPPWLCDSCTGEYSLNDNKSSAFIFTGFHYLFLQNKNYAFIKVK